jgi:hypothetical protein
MVTSGIASAVHLTVLTIAHAIKVRVAVIESPAGFSVLPSFTESLAKCGSLLHGYPLFQLLPSLFSGTWLDLWLGLWLDLLRLNKSRSARKAQPKSQRKCNFFDIPEVHSSPYLSECVTAN